ncbi:hypothetical protein BDZ89DRAFT_956806, partial [Hymenopellis radicata]
LLEALSISSTIASTFMVYQGLSLLVNCESPLVVVLRHVFLLHSGSMEPAFYRGDILFLTNFTSRRHETGDIIVYQVGSRQDIPIVHRIIETHDITQKSDTCRPPEQLILTKGDNNPVDDFELYKGVHWLERKHVVGTVRGFLPYVGYISVFLVRSFAYLL